MSPIKHTLFVKSEKPPVVEFDAECGAVYIKFNNRKIDRTVERASDGMVVTVDLDRSGLVVGIEALCFDEFSISQLLKVANVRAEGIDFSKAKFRTAPRQVEIEPLSV